MNPIGTFKIGNSYAVTWMVSYSSLGLSDYRLYLCIQHSYAWWQWLSHDWRWYLLLCILHSILSNCFFIRLARSKTPKEKTTTPSWKLSIRERKHLLWGCFYVYKLQSSFALITDCINAIFMVRYVRSLLSKYALWLPPHRPKKRNRNDESRQQYAGIKTNALLEWSPQ